MVATQVCEALDRMVEIPAGDLAHSLEQLSRQLDIQILYDADRLKGLKSPAIKGSLTAQEALGQLLSGTALTFQGGGDSFLVMPESLPRTTAAPATADHAPPRATMELDELTVTGTHIRGEVPVGAALSTYAREDVDRLGAASVDELARDMLENFSGADAQATLNTNGTVGRLQQGAAPNIFGGAGFDLLGLGSGATLTLLDGHRIAPGGLDGSMVDVSLIPLSAIDRIEVLTDGASAIYGSDAVAGVVNLVSRRAVVGDAQTSVRYGRSTEGGAGELTASQLLGQAWSTGNVLLDLDYADQQGLDASERAWIGPEGGPYSLIPENRRQSLFLVGTQTLGATALSFEGLTSYRNFRMSGLQLSTSGFVPNSEIGGGHANLQWAALTVDQSLPAAWHLSGSATRSSMDQSRQAEEFPDGLSGDHFNNILRVDSGVTALDVFASGPAFRVPSGNFRLALGAGFRSDTFRGSAPSIEPLPVVSQNRTDLIGYGEAIAPLFGEDWSFPGMRRLSVSAAYRVDHYNNVSASPNAKWGVSWEPTAGLTVRATQGTSFRAPLISQLYTPNTAYTTLLPSSTPGDRPTDALVINGGSQYLLSETSRALTAGIDWTPVRWPWIRSSLNYYNVTYRNRIQSQNITAAPLEAQPQLLPLTFLNPSQDYVRSLFSGPSFQQDSAGLGPSGVTALITNTLANEGVTVEQGIRFDGRYMVDGGRPGRWTYLFSGNYLLVDGTSFQTYFPAVANVTNTVAEPPKFRLRTGVSWEYRNMTADVTLNHTSAYQNTLFSPTQKVASWTTADLALIASIPDHPNAFWHDLNVVLNVQNLADRRPPFLEIPAGDIATGRSAVPFDGTNASAVGRYISIEFRTGWR
jgi:iron complex outermembrane recepter protein